MHIFVINSSSVFPFCSSFDVFVLLFFRSLFLVSLFIPANCSLRELFYWLFLQIQWPCTFHVVVIIIVVSGFSWFLLKYLMYFARFCQSLASGKRLSQRILCYRDLVKRAFIRVKFNKKLNCWLFNVDFTENSWKAPTTLNYTFEKKLIFTWKINYVEVAMYVYFGIIIIYLESRANYFSQFDGFYVFHSIRNVRNSLLRDYFVIWKANEKHRKRHVGITLEMYRATRRNASEQSAFRFSAKRCETVGIRQVGALWERPHQTTAKSYGCSLPPRKPICIAISRKGVNRA